MAKSEEKKDDQVEETPQVAKVASEAPAPTEQPQPQQQAQVQLDDSNAQVCYANFCRVNGTPEELIIDFGLNDQPFGAPQKSLMISQRLVINHYTAKRLLAALQMSIQRHEAAFGVLETNVQKRVLPAAMRGGQQS